MRQRKNEQLISAVAVLLKDCAMKETADRAGQKKDLNVVRWLAAVHLYGDAQRESSETG